MKKVLLSVLLLICSFSITCCPLSAQDFSIQKNTTVLDRLAKGPAATVEVRNDTLFYGAGGNLHIADVSDRSNPTSISKIQLPATILKLVVKGDYVYTISNSYTIRIVDISNPARPVVRGALDTKWDFNDMAFSENNLYIATKDNGLQIVDVSKPASPERIGQWEDDFNTNRFTYLDVRDSLLYIIDNQLDNFLLIDVKNADNPRLIVSHNLDVWSLYDIKVQGDYVYLLSDDNFQVYNVADTADITLEADIDLYTSSTIELPRNIVIRDSTAMLTGGSDAIEVAEIDISNPASPVIQSSKTIETSDYYEGGREIAVSDSIAYVAGDNAGIFIFQMRPGDPIEKLARIKSWSQYHHLSVGPEQKRAVVTQFNKIRLINKEEPTNLKVQNTYIDSSRISAVALRDSLLLYTTIGEEKGYLKVVDISDPNQPVERSVYRNLTEPYDIAANDSLAFIVDDEEGLHVIDYKDSSNPSLITTHDLTGRIKMIGDYVYEKRYAIERIPVREPSSLQEYNHADISISDIDVRDSLIYAGTWNDLYVFRMSGQNQLKLAKRVRMDEHSHLEAEGNYMYTGSYSSYVKGVKMWNVSNLDRLLLSGYLYFGGIRDLEVNGGNIMALSNTGGLYMIENDYFDNVEQPTLSEPQSKTIVGTNTPTFTWSQPGFSKAPDKYSFNVLVGRDSVFHQAFIDTTVGQEKFVAEDSLSENHRYYWSIMTSYEEGGKMFSPTRSFYIDAEKEPPSRVDIVSPANGQNQVAQMPTLVWNESVDPDPKDYPRYKVILAENEGLTQNRKSFNTGTDTTITPESELKDNSKYYWAVRAADLDSLHAYSDTLSFVVGTITGMADKSQLPEEFKLHNPYPSPFNPSTTIKYGLPEVSSVRINVYNVIGRRVRTLVDSRKSAGRHRVQFKAKNLPSGQYIIRMKTGSGYVSEKSVILIK